MRLWIQASNRSASPKFWFRWKDLYGKGLSSLSQLKKYKIPVCATLNRILKAPSKEKVKKFEVNAILVIKMRQGESKLRVI